MQIDVRSNVADVRAMFSQYPDITRAAIVSALNRAAKQGKTRMARRIKERRKLSMSISDIKSRLKLRLASRNRLVAGISITGGRIPLERFKHRVSKAGVKANVVGEGYHGPATKFGNKAFELPNGSGQIWVRISNKRYPIARVSGPSLPSAISAHKWEQTDLDPRLETKFYELLESQLRWRLRSHISR